MRKVHSEAWGVRVLVTGIPVLGATSAWIRSSPWCWFLGFALLAIGWCRPKLLVPIYRMVVSVGAQVSRGIFAFLSAIIYFFVLTPLALLMRSTGHSFLTIGFEPQKDSYYEKDDSSSGLDRQF